MAKLFDPKQDVLDIQLTQYGKHLLSKGQMRPHSYAFFDNDIIYDGLYANVTESQNEAQDRIKNKTVRPQPQYVFHGIETNIKRNIQQTLDSKVDLLAPALQATADKFYSLNDPIGTCDPNAENIPAWNAKFLNAPLSASAMYMTGNHQNINIPQLDTVYELNVRAVPGTPGIELSEESSEQASAINEIISSNYLDGSYFVGQHGYLFLDVKELNTIMGTDNFDIEVFEIETETDKKTGANKEVLRSLQFLPEDNARIGVGNEEVLAQNFPVLNPSYAGYYFNILVDDEIGDDIFCAAKTRFKKIDIFSDSDRVFDCIDVERFGPSLYDENIEAEEECNT